MLGNECKVRLPASEVEVLHFSLLLLNMHGCRSESPEAISSQIPRKRPATHSSDGDPDYEPEKWSGEYDWLATAGLRAPPMAVQPPFGQPAEKGLATGFRKPHTARLQFWTHVSSSVVLLMLGSGSSREAP